MAGSAIVDGTVRDGVPDHDGVSRLTMWAVGAAAGCALLVVVFQLTAVPITNAYYGLFHNYTDLRVYRAGAQTVLDSRSLYGSSVWAWLDFTYPPFAAIVFVPLTVVGEAVAHDVWTTLSIASLLAVIVIGLRSLGYRLDARLWMFATFATVAATALEPIRTTLWLGQINIVLMLLVVADLVGLGRVRLRSRLLGIGVGLAAGLKLTPLFFVVYLLATRRWRAAMTALASFGATVAIGFALIPHDAWTYWSTDIGGASRIGRVDSPANQSVNGFLSQMLAYLDIRRFAHPAHGFPASAPVFSAPGWMWVPVAVVAALLGLWAAALAHRRGRDLLAVAITGMTGSMVSPFSWGHHWVWFVPLILVAIDVAHRATMADLRRGIWWWLAPAAIVTLSFTWWHIWYQTPRHFGSDHTIAMGLFMMPRWPDPGWWDYVSVTIYAGCYPFVWLLTVVVTLVACRRPAPAGAHSGQWRRNPYSAAR